MLKKLLQQENYKRIKRKLFNQTNVETKLHGESKMIQMCFDNNNDNKNEIVIRSRKWKIALREE